MNRRVAIAALTIGAACGDSASRATQPATLKVSATHGLSEFAITGEVTGSTAYALDLVYDPISAHAELLGIDDATVTMRRRPLSPHDVNELANSVRAVGVVAATTRADEIVVTMTDGAAARNMFARGGFATAPFALADQRPDRVRLSARDPELALEAIEIVAMSASEEWRRLLAHEVDVIPNAAAIHRDQFVGMDSIRTIDLPVESVVGLFFNTADPALADPSVRRAIAAEINGEAVARVACGSSSCATSWWRGEASEVLPTSLSLVALDSEPFTQTAAVLRHQLGRAGIEVSVNLVEVESLAERWNRGDFQLAVLALPTGSSAAVASLAAGYGNTGFAVPELDGDPEFALATLARAMPALPLYELREFAAVDRSFCGGAPESPTSWRWLADLYPCAGAVR